MLNDYHTPIGTKQSHLASSQSSLVIHPEGQAEIPSAYYCVREGNLTGIGKPKVMDSMDNEHAYQCLPITGICSRVILWRDLHMGMRVGVVAPRTVKAMAPSRDLGEYEE